MNIPNSNQHASNSLIWAYCSNGNLEEAKTLMNELETRSLTEYIAGTYFGIAAAYLGDFDATFDFLENAYNDHEPNLIQLKYSPFVPATLRNEPRFQNLLDRIGFPK